MPATIIDSRIFGDMFSDERMRQVWSDENRTAKYVEVEKALAIVQGRLGLIPKEAADEIVRSSLELEADRVRFIVEDRGGGLGSGDPSRLFEPFYRARDGERRAHPRARLHADPDHGRGTHRRA